MASQAQDTPSDLTPFKNANQSGIALAPNYTAPLERHMVGQIGYGIDPDFAPISMLSKMGRHPTVYLAERRISGIMRRPDLYSVTHADAAMKAEVEAWLWPLLPRVLQAAARAFALGSSALVFDWSVRDLRLQVPTADGLKTRLRTLRDHVHYGTVHEVPNDIVKLDVDGAYDLKALNVWQVAFDPDRVHVWVWDPEPRNPWLGQGARRRAWADYCELLILSFMRTKYLEKNVDLPRVGYCPPGETKTTPDGPPVSNASIMQAILFGSRNGAAIVLPDTRDEKGNRRWEASILPGPNGAGDEFTRAIEMAEARIAMSYLVAPSMGGLEDPASGGAGRALEGAVYEFVEDLAIWVAQGLTAIVEQVHRMNYGEDTPAPSVEVTDVGKAGARKLLLAALQIAPQAGLEIARRMDVPKVLDRVGVPLREEVPADVAAATQVPVEPVAKGKAGRPRDLTGDREQRREDAATEDGADAVGAPDEAPASNVA